MGCDAGMGKCMPWGRMLLEGLHPGGKCWGGGVERQSLLSLARHVMYSAAAERTAPNSMASGLNGGGTGPPGRQRLCWQLPTCLQRLQGCDGCVLAGEAC